MKIEDYLKIDYENTLLALSYILGKNRNRILLEKDYDLNPDDEERLKKVLSDVDQGLPLQYALGIWNFYGLDLKVDRRALIPRPETELLVETIIKSKIKKDKILDLGQGSGAISLALADNLKDSQVTGVDVSKEAVDLALENKKLLGLSNVNFFQSDLFSNITGSFDLIVSNPPYINKKDYEKLDRKLYYEPKLALYGGEDGLFFYRRIIKEGPSHLNPQGRIFFEIGYDQGQALKELFIDGGFEDIGLIKDYNEIDRIAFARLGGQDGRDA